MALTKTNLANIVEGILPVANGGTGSSSLSGANLAVTNATNTFTVDQSISGLTVGKGGGASNLNTAVGLSALVVNTGTDNTGIGSGGLGQNTTGSANTAIGRLASYSNTTGSYNTSVGNGALQANTTASNNTAVGYQALYSNTTGTPNVAVGAQALYSQTTGNNNCAIGYYAGNAVTTGTYNSLLGHGAGYLITTGGKNTVVGAYSGNQGSLDIRTASNYIVLSDGDGNPRGYYNASSNSWNLTGGVTGTPTFSAYYSGNTTTVSSSTWTKITFDTEDFDTNSNFASNRFTPTVAGYYQINIVASCAQNGASTAQVNIAIYKNGSIYKSLQSTSVGGQYIGVTNTAVVYFNGSTDYVEGYIWGSSAMNYYGTANTGSGGTGANNTYMSGVLVRGA